MPVATQSSSSAQQRQRSVAVQTPATPAGPPAPAGVGAILEPSAAPSTGAAQSDAAAALIAWLNAQARQHLRPGCRIAVVGAEAENLARELTRRGYDSTAVPPESAASLRSRFDFVVAHAPDDVSAGETLGLAATLPRAHGGLVALAAEGRGASSRAAAVLEAQGFAPAPAQGGVSASTCWRRRV